MTPREKRVVLKHLRQILGTWHRCRLTQDWPEMKQKKGQLCDDCEALAKAHMKDIAGESVEP